MRRTAQHALSIAVAALVAGAHPAAASGSPAYTATVQSSLADKPLPKPLATAACSRSSSGWTLTTEGLAPPLGTTTATALWKSPWFRAHFRQLLLAADVEIAEQPGTGSDVDVLQEMRLCVPGHCGPWQRLGIDGSPMYGISSLPGRVGVGEGLTYIWTNSTARVRMEYRYTEKQSSGDYAKITATLTGPAARA